MSLEMFCVRINLSLFLLLSAVTLFIYHSKAVNPQIDAAMALGAGILGLGIIFLPLLLFLKLQNQKLFMIAFSAIIGWIGTIAGGQLLFLQSIHADIFYYFALIAILACFMLFLVIHIYQLLNQIAKK